MRWQVFIRDEPHIMRSTMFVYRENGNMITYAGPSGEMWTLDEGVAPPEDVEWRLPYGAHQAIVEFAAPHADSGEVKALRESLEKERSRVDHVLGIS